MFSEPETIQESCEWVSAYGDLRACRHSLWTYFAPECNNGRTKEDHTHQHKAAHFHSGSLVQDIGLGGGQCGEVVAEGRDTSGVVAVQLGVALTVQQSPGGIKIAFARSISIRCRLASLVVRDNSATTSGMASATASSLAATNRGSTSS